MIAVENVIRKLINEYEFVILPGFGALLSHQIPASFDKHSGFFSPPAKKLAFNEYLKLDDGLLANYISRHEGISHAEAVEYIKAYIDKLKNALEVSGNALISGIGAFGKNIEGKLIFQPNTEKYFKDEWYGFEKVKVAHFNQAAPAPVVRELVSEEEVEILEDEKRASRKWIGWAAAAVIAGLLCGLSVFFVNSNGELKSTLNPFNDLFSRSYEKTQGLETSAVEEVVAEEKQPEMTNPAMAPAPVAVDSASEPVAVAVEAPVTKTLTVPTPVETKSAAKYYVIAGAFKGTKRANVLLAELKEKGFENALILPTDKYNKKVKVAIDGYETEKEAHRASGQLKSVIGEVGWVFKNKNF